MNSSKRIKHLVLSSNDLKMARNEDFEGALENVISLNLANTQTYEKVAESLTSLTLMQILEQQFLLTKAFS